VAPFVFAFLMEDLDVAWARALASVLGVCA
jgi:hypothetical protein